MGHGSAVDLEEWGRSGEGICSGIVHACMKLSRNKKILKLSLKKKNQIIILIVLLMYTCMFVCMLQPPCGAQRTTCRSWFCPSTMWVLGSNSDHQA